LTYCNGNNIIIAVAIKRGEKVSPRTGRPPKENPRNMSLQLRLTQQEADLIKKCAEMLGVSRTDAIVRGIELLMAER
jgi:hypothetical protein